MYKPYSAATLKRYANISAKIQYADLCKIYGKDKVNRVFVNSAIDSLRNLRIKSNGMRSMDTDDRVMCLRQNVVIAYYFLQAAKLIVGENAEVTK